MFGMNRQEQQISLFLLVSFFIGCGIKLYQNHSAGQVNPEWQDRYSRIYQSFQHKSQLIDLADSVRSQPNVPALRKQDLIGKVNINTATSVQLQTLRKIGPALAERIILYRKENGPFRHIDEIKNVKGIGDKTFEKIKNNLTID